MADINHAEGKELFESLFASTGSRETVSVDDWIAGWPAIVGGINGIPTSRQFNTLQNVTDMKCLLLYQRMLELQEEIKDLKELVENGGGIVAVGRGGFTYVGSINRGINNGDVLFIITADIEGGLMTAGGMLHAGNSDDDIGEKDVLFILSRERVAGDGEGGMVYVGEKAAAIRPRGILFVISSYDKPEFLFRQAQVTNMLVSKEMPSEGQNWGFIKGKLTTGEKPETDTKFYARIGGN